MKRTIFTLALSLTALCIFAQADTVINLNDSGTGSLRDVINSASSGDTIRFDTSLDGDTIFLTSGQITINRSLVILGNGPGLTFVDGSQDVDRDSRFINHIGGELRLTGISFSNGGDTSLATGFGGAIITTGADALILKDCNFENNSSFLAGAIRLNEGTELFMNRCSFRGNRSAIVGGAVNSRADSNRITNCLFVGNTSGTTAGALAHEVGSMDIFNCTFADNESNGTGGALEKAANIDSLINCIFYNNLDNGTPSDIAGGGNITVGHHNSLEEYTGSGLTNGSNGNISENPRFVGGGDYSLQYISPCLNTGTNIDQSEPTDIRGRKRMINEVQDMGAYEFFCPLGTGSRLLVDIDATGNDDGLRWSDAITDLQDAIELACDCDILVGEIWVAEGTYLPTLTFNPDVAATDRDKTFYIPKNVKLFGGFDGTEYARSQRDWREHETILSGDIGVTGDSTDNSYHIMLIHGELERGNIDRSCEIDGFIFEHGLCNGTNPAYAGGAIYVRGRNAGNVCNPTIANCTFRENQGRYAGAIFLDGRLGETSAKIANCSFLKNEVSNDGGAIYAWNTASTRYELSNSVFLNNKANIGGAIYNNACYASITNCSFSKNLAVINGGAIYNSVTDSITISNCIFWENEANLENEIYESSSLNHTTLSHSIIGGGVPTDVIDGGNNLDSDPLFRDSTDLRLTLGSPAINAGNNDSIPDGITTDLAGSPRIIRDTVDMGAYENLCPGAQNALLVDIDATGPEHGNIWSGAFRDLQDAIDLACECDSLAGEIWVAEGTYLPTDTVSLGILPASDRHKTFYIPKNLAIYGGFDGSETARADRDFRAHETILSGDIGVTGDSTDNSYHIMIIHGESVRGNIDSSCVVDGFSFRGGNCDGPFPESAGGGIHTRGREGGNICSPTISNCSFSSNSGIFGAGIFNDGASLGNNSTRILNCAFTKNETSLAGAAIYNWGSTGSCSTEMINCAFYKNSCANGGAIFSTGSVGQNDHEIINCSFSQNMASQQGGAISSEGMSSLDIQGSIFWGNTAPNSSGAQIASTSSESVTIAYSILEDDTEDGMVIMPPNVTDGGNNLDADPLFLDTLTGDLRLSTGSPAINQGNNDAIPSDVETDLQGSFRIMDQYVDIGAYELSGSECKTATRVSCGDTIQGTASFQSDQAESLLDCYDDQGFNVTFHRSIWKTFEGTGDSITVTLSDYQAMSNLEMTIYSGTCGNFQCEAHVQFSSPDPSSLSIQTHKDSTYYIMIAIFSSPTLILGDYTFSMACNCGSQDLVYSSPQDFIRGDVHKIETDQTIEATNLIGSGADIIYDGATSIDLQAGFEVKAGAEFLAVPDGCGGVYAGEETEGDK